MFLAIAAVLASGSVAAADTSGEPPERLVIHARSLARAHDCAGARAVAAEVAAANEQLYTDDVVRDPEIGPCLANGPVLTPAQIGPREDVVPKGGKSPNVALGLSAGVSLLGGALGLAAIVPSKGGWFEINKPLAIVGTGIALIGPSLGNIYAGNTLNVGLGIRVAGLGIMGAMLARCGSPGCSTSDTTANVMLAAATIVYGAGVITEVALAPRAARAYNRRMMQVVPAAMPNGRDGLSPGVALTGTF
jgi:hypothetical protein